MRGIDDRNAGEAVIRVRRLRGGRQLTAYGTASLVAVDAENWRQATAWSARALKQNPQQHEALVARGSLLLAQRDISLLGKMPITLLTMEASKIDALAPCKDMPLVELHVG